MKKSKQKQRKRTWLDDFWDFILQHQIIFFWIPIALYMGLIFYLSAMPRAPVPGLMIELFSKWTTTILHFLEFFVLSLMLGVAFRHNKNKFLQKNAYLLAIIIAGLYGMGDEFHQFFVPGRFATIGDAFVDVLGAMFAQVVRFFTKKNKFLNQYF